MALPLYADEDFGLDLDNAVYALDASTIDLRLSVFAWALVRSTESAVKLQTLLDLQGNILTFTHISDGKLHDVNVLDLLIPEPGAFYIMDRGHVDFERLFTLHRTGRFFVIHAKPKEEPREAGEREHRAECATPGRRRAEHLVGVRRVSAGGDEMPGHATRRQVIAGVLVPHGVRAGADAGRTRAAEGNGRRPIVCTRNRTDPISGCAKNGDAPVPNTGVATLIPGDESGSVRCDRTIAR